MKSCDADFALASSSAVCDTAPIQHQGLDCTGIACVIRWRSALNERGNFMKHSRSGRKLPPPFLISEALRITSATSHAQPKPPTALRNATKAFMAGLMGMACLTLLFTAWTAPTPPPPAAPEPLVVLTSPKTWPVSKPVPPPRRNKKTPPAESDQQELDEMMAAHYLARLPRP